MDPYADLEIFEIGVRGAASHDYFCPQFDQETGGATLKLQKLPVWGKISDQRGEEGGVATRYHPLNPPMKVEYARIYLYIAL